MKRIKIGDLFEISTVKGLVYGQFTHKNKEYGALIRVFSGFYDRRPQDLTIVREQAVQFISFFPIQSAVNAGLITFCSNQAISQENSIFPIFRSANFSKNATRDADDWWLWDGHPEF